MDEKNYIIFLQIKVMSLLYKDSRYVKASIIEIYY